MKLTGYADRLDVMGEKKRNQGYPMVLFTQLKKWCAKFLGWKVRAKNAFV